MGRHHVSPKKRVPSRKSFLEHVLTAACCCLADARHTIQYGQFFSSLNSLKELLPRLDIGSTHYTNPNEKIVTNTNLPCEDLSVLKLMIVHFETRIILGYKNGALFQKN